MSDLKFSILARDDLNDIWEFIAQDNSLAASRFIDLIEQKCYLLADNPKIGRQRNELASELRSFPVKSYVIYYRCCERGIEIIRILSSARDIDSIWF